MIRKQADEHPLPIALVKKSNLPSYSSEKDGQSQQQERAACKVNPPAGGGADQKELARSIGKICADGAAISRYRM